MVTTRNSLIPMHCIFFFLVLAIEHVADTLLVNFCQKYLASVILHDHACSLFLKYVFYTFLWLSEEKMLKWEIYL